MNRSSTAKSRATILDETVASSQPLSRWSPTAFLGVMQRDDQRDRWQAACSSASGLEAEQRNGAVEAPATERLRKFYWIAVCAHLCGGSRQTMRSRVSELRALDQHNIIFGSHFP
jgi:hypothetical protein